MRRTTRGGRGVFKFPRKRVVQAKYGARMGIRLPPPQQHTPAASHNEYQNVGEQEVQTARVDTRCHEPCSAAPAHRSCARTLVMCACDEPAGACGSPSDAPGSREENAELDKRTS